MTLPHGDLSRLRRIIQLAQKLVAKHKTTKNDGKSARNGTHIRRTGKELARFRKMLRAERRKGVPVSELARKHGISSAYIYVLR